MPKRGAARTAGGETDNASEAELPAALPGPVAAGLVFCAAGAVLMLEILAVRLLAPYVGLTLETTTSIIGAALAGIAAGAAVGGYFADRIDTRRLIVGLLIGGGLLTLLTVPVVRWLGPGVRGDGDLAALGVTVAALVPAAAALSAVSPAVAHLQLHDLHASGTVVGRLSAWATAGALVGTFGTGFVLVPLMPVGAAVLIIGTVLVLIGIGLGASSRALSATGLAALAIAAVALGALSTLPDSPCDRETKYHCVQIEPDSAQSGYHLVLDGEYNSFIDPDNPRHLLYPYTRWIAKAIDVKEGRGKPLDAVFVGGAAFTLPRWLESTHPGSTSRVLEVDGELVDFAKERLGLRTSPQLTASVGDARVEMLNVPSNSADVVVGDAFSGLTVPWHLTTTEWLKEVQRVLKPDGLYALNMIDLLPLDLLKAETATMLDTFGYTVLIAYSGEDGQPAGGNAVLLGFNRALPMSLDPLRNDAAVFNLPGTKAFAAGGEHLSDDFAPVDQLLTTE